MTDNSIDTIVIIGQIKIRTGTDMYVDHQNRWSLMVWCGIVNGYLIGP